MVLVITSRDKEPIYENEISTARVIIAGALSTSGIGALVASALSYIYDPAALSDSQRLAFDCEDNKYTKKLGYMNSVKRNLMQIKDFLDKPETVPLFLNYLLPDMFSFLLDTYLVRSFFDLDKKTKLPCRLVIFVDDLDRCPPEKSVDILKW
jgi:hypothetical protein